MAKKIGLRKTSDGAAGMGTVESIHFSAEDGGSSARISLRFGPKPKRGKDGMTVGPWPETVSLPLPASVARECQVGDRVRVSLTKVGKS